MLLYSRPCVSLSITKHPKSVLERRSFLRKVYIGFSLCIRIKQSIVTAWPGYSLSAVLLSPYSSFRLCSGPWRTWDWSQWGRTHLKSLSDWSSQSSLVSLIGGIKGLPFWLWVFPTYWIGFETPVLF